jgi:signal transduction histidine kinase
MGAPDHSLQARHQPERAVDTGRLGFDRPPWNTRVAVITGFGGLLLTMALAGGDALRVLRQVQREDDQIRRQFLFRDHVLNDVRSELYLSGTYVRDYLLEPEPVRAETFRASLEDVHNQMESALQAYGQQLSSEERTQYSALTTELSRYWGVLGPILRWSASERHERGYRFLRDEVFPRRAAMLEIASRIADFNERQLNAGNERVVSLLATFRTRLGLTLLASLALGLGMAVFSTRKILGLEAKSELRYQEVVEARRHLTNLSAKLVQVQEGERRALSRELHDEVGQALSAVLVELRNLSLKPAVQSSAESRGNVEVIKGLVEGAVRVVRNMALLLRPSMLDDLGLIPALRWQAREVSKRTSMDVSVVAELASDDFPDEYKTCLYRIVQEALHNCSRHSQATTVRIRVQQQTDKLLLWIQDDGQGFDVNQGRGLGLLGIEERVARLGGKCEIHSSQARGTIIAIELPLGVAESKSGNTAGNVYESETNPHSVGR